MMKTNTTNQRLQTIGDRAWMLNSPANDSINNTSQGLQPRNIGTDNNASRNLQSGNAGASNRGLGMSGNSSVATSIARGLPSRGISAPAPEVKTTVNGVFDMGTGTLTMTKYEDGKATKSVTIKPGEAGSKNLGVFSGSGKGMNESEYSKNTDIGPMPLGTYDIHNNSELGTRQGGPREGYKEKYGVKGGWYRLEYHDNDRNDDHATVRGTRGIKIAERKNIRGHIGYGSAGCLTVHPDNKQKWLQIEDMLGTTQSTDKVLGTVEVIDSRPGLGNGSTDSASKNTDVLNASNQAKQRGVERTM
jgi:Protein of unknown function (DUF2778)